VDSERVLSSPFNLTEWIQNNQHGIDNQGRLALFDTEHHQLQASDVQTRSTYLYGALRLLNLRRHANVKHDFHGKQLAARKA